jgi:hypothetical protein
VYIAAATGSITPSGETTWFGSYNSGAASCKLIWLLRGYRSCPMLDLSKQKLEVRR